MKKLFIIAALGVASLGKALAQEENGLPNFVTLTSAGNAAAPASVYFRAKPQQQVRAVSVSYTTDTNNAAILFQAGVGAYYQTATNASTSSVTNWVNTTNGLLPGSTMVLEQKGTPYVATLASFGAVSNTNSLGATTNAYFIVLGSGGWGVAANPLTDIYQMSATGSLPVGKGTNSIFGVCLWAAKHGRPLLMTLTPALSTNQFNSVTGRYE